MGLIRYTDEEGHPHLLYVSDAKSTKGHVAPGSGHVAHGGVEFLLGVHTREGGGLVVAEGSDSVFKGVGVRRIEEPVGVVVGSAVGVGVGGAGGVAVGVAVGSGVDVGLGV